MFFFIGLVMSTTTQKFRRYTCKNHTLQAKAFLNAYWEENQGDAEELWNLVHKFMEQDHENGKEGCDLDEFKAHVFLESLSETKRVVELREQLRESDLDFNRRLSFLEFCLFRYKKKVTDFLRRDPPTEDCKPGSMSPAAMKAQEALQAVRSEISRIENLKAELEEKASGSGVKAMQAKNELQQLLTRDNTDLNRALLTAEAALRKAGGGGDIPPGSMWWMNRELQEMKKYRPQRKQ